MNECGGGGREVGTVKVALIVGRYHTTYYLMWVPDSLPACLPPHCLRRCLYAVVWYAVW